MDPAKIAKHYALSLRFLLDLVASVPIDLIAEVFMTKEEEEEEKDNFAVNFTGNITGMLKLIRLLRLGRIFTLMRLREDWLWLKNLPVIFGYLILIHWIGCLWYINVRGTDWIPPYDLNE